MNNTTTTVIVVVLVILAVLGVYYFAVNGPATVPTATTTPQAQNSATSTLPSAAEVRIQDFAFAPGTIRVRTGTKVTWTNDDAVAHTATADSGLFDSGSIGPGQSFSYTFTAPGTVTYYCKPHPNMRKATVVVED